MVCNLSKSIHRKANLVLYISSYSDMFKNNQEYSGIIQGYLATFRGLYNLVIFRSLAYLQPLKIENHVIFRTLVYWEIWHFPNPRVFWTMAYSYLQLSHIQNFFILELLVWKCSWKLNSIDWRYSCCILIWCQSMRKVFLGKYILFMRNE